MAPAKAQAGSAFTSLVNSFFVSLVVGVNLIIFPHDRGEVFSMCYLVIASFAVALSRAWSLVQGRRLAVRPAGGK